MKNFKFLEVKRIFIKSGKEVGVGQLFSRNRTV